MPCMKLCKDWAPVASLLRRGSSLDCSKSSAPTVVAHSRGCQHRLRRCDMRNATCSICGEPTTARGWCGTHYRRWLNYGDPLGGPHVPPVPDLPGERWLPVVGYEGLYLISDFGRVKSILRNRVKLMRPTLRRSGHAYIWLCRNGARKTGSVHQMVAAAFIGPRPPGQIVRHGPGGVLDNRAVNLSYGTHAQNLGPDKVRDGTDPSGERNPRTSLTNAEVKHIRQLYAQGDCSQAELAARAGISRSGMAQLLRGATWASAGGPVGSRHRARYVA